MTTPAKDPTTPGMDLISVWHRLHELIQLGQALEIARGERPPEMPVSEWDARLIDAGDLMRARQAELTDLEHRLAAWITLAPGPAPEALLDAARLVRFVVSLSERAFAMHLAPAQHFLLKAAAELIQNSQDERNSQ